MSAQQKARRRDNTITTRRQRRSVNSTIGTAARRGAFDVIGDEIEGGWGR